MPELPEVETIRQQLSQILPLRVKNINKSKVSSSIIKVEELSLVGDQIQKIDRFGKMLIFRTASGAVMLSHLGMSGGWRINQFPSIEKHTHFELFGENGDGQCFFLSYVDPRRFGKIKLLSAASFALVSQKYSRDISDKSFSTKDIEAALSRHPKLPIKALLLDQKYFPGVGNYIACEICAYARILPTRPAGLVKKVEVRGVLKAIKKVITKSIKSRGMTFHGGYADTTGAKGEGVNHLVVFYQKFCGLCKKTKIKKIVLSGRGTYFCPKCQK